MVTILNRHYTLKEAHPGSLLQSSGNAIKKNCGYTVFSLFKNVCYGSAEYYSRFFSLKTAESIRDLAKGFDITTQYLIITKIWTYTGKNCYTSFSKLIKGEGVIDQKFSDCIILKTGYDLINFSVDVNRLAKLVKKGVYHPIMRVLDSSKKVYDLANDIFIFYYLESNGLENSNTYVKEKRIHLALSVAYRVLDLSIIIIGFVGFMYGGMLASTTFYIWTVDTGSKALEFGSDVYEQSMSYQIDDIQEDVS